MIETHALVFFLIPTLAGVASALFGLAWKPSAQVRSGVQHFAAGIVFAAVASEIIPEILERNFVVAFAIGFPLGVALVVALRQLDRLMQRRRAASGSTQAAGAMGIVAPVAVDLSIDGLLVGVGFISGTGMGRLLAIALTMEMMFLGLSVAQMLTKHGYARRQAATMTVGLAFVPITVGLLTITFLGGLSGTALVILLSFGSAALLYLVTEDLLLEAHESNPNDSIWVTALFFVGFMAVILVEGA